MSYGCSLCGREDRFILIYLDDMNVFSNKYDDHMKNLRNTFVKCKKLVLSLNPKKSCFDMTEGNLMGHIFPKEGVKIDPKRVEEIKLITLPRNKKEIQSFIGRINFLRKFVPNFVEMIRCITNMLKKDHHEAKEYFQIIK
jgi:hypothetical protein